MRTLRKSLIFSWAFLALTTALLPACSDDDNSLDGNANNANANKATVNAPHITRMEFPRVKGGSSIVVTHKTTDRYGINYSVEWDCEKKTQRWSCYQMYYGFTGNAGRYQPDPKYDNYNPGNHPEGPQYPFDPKLPENAYFSTDYYWGSGFDHGHICPSADRLYSKEANYQTFFMSNMQPQYKNFNARLWADMEGKLRAWSSKTASNKDTLYICKGGTVDREDQILRRISGKQIVPKYFYMAILMKNSMGYRAMAFWAENENEDRGGDNLAKYAISIDELEARTGIDFFCNLPDDIENHVESNLVLSVWGLRK